MKQFTALLLALFLLLFIVACTPVAAPTPQTAPEAAPPAPEAPDAPDAPVIIAPDASQPEEEPDAYAWPEGDAGLRVPEFQGGSITGLLDNGDNCTITISGADAADYAAYVAELQEAGFTSDANEVSQDPMFMYSAASEDGYYASVSFSDGEIVISAEFMG